MRPATLSVAWATNGDLASVTDSDLQAAEFERASRFGSELRRQQYTASRAMLRALLADYTGRPASSFQLGADDRGKPLCVDGPAVSISHSGDFVACAVCDVGDIGVDLEFWNRSRDVEAIARRFFSPEESEWLATQPADHFYRLWVLKEAWLKATGVGLSGGLDKLRCIVTPPVIETLAGSAPVAALRLYALRDGLLGIAAVDERPAGIEVRRWSPARNKFIADDDLRLVADSEAVG